MLSRYSRRSWNYGALLMAVSTMLLVACLLWAPPAGAEHGGPASDPDTTCTGGQTVALTVELGKGVPLPRQYSGSTRSDTTITGTMLANSLFGPERVVFSEDIKKGLGVIFSEAPVILTSPSTTPLGTDRVMVEFRSSVTGGTVIARCDYLVTIVLPAGLRDLIQVPVRWCAIEGSPQAEGHRAGEMASSSNLLLLLQRANDQIWVPGAHIGFRSAPAVGIPVIKDPLRPEEGGRGQLGDIDIGGFGEPFEASQATVECEQAWADLYPVGVILVNTGRYINGGGTLGFTPPPDKGLFVYQASDPIPSSTGRRGDDLCGQPRHLTVADITGQYVNVGDQDLHRESPAHTLAHELGHALLLGHGNGLDDNHDGLEPPTPGPRRYDQYCDPLGATTVGGIPDIPREEADVLRSCDSGSLMMQAARCTNLRPLQTEQARAAAKLVPGATFDASVDPAGALVVPFRGCPPPCGLPPDIFIVKVEVSQTPGNQTTGFSHTVWGPIPPDANNQYLMFADLDNNLATGCAPSALGFPTSFQGAELVTRVSLALVAGAQQVTPTVWRCQNNTFVPVTDPGIRAAAFTQAARTHEGQVVPGFGIVSINLPDAMRGPVGTQVRIQALAQQLGSAGQLDRLPSAPDSGGIVSLVPPPLPQCSLTPPITNPGGTATIGAGGLLVNRRVEVYLGDQLVGTGPTDGNGNVHLDIIVPANSPQGVRPIMVLVSGTAVSATCAALVEGPLFDPDLKTTKSVDKPDATPGDTLTYTVGIQNIGTGPATAVKLTDTKPDGTAETRALSDILNGASTTQTFTFLVPCNTTDLTVLTNSATVSAENLLHNPEVNTSNNTATASTTVHTPVLTLGKTATASVNAGEAITYTITYQNTGSSGATNVVITDTLPAGIYYSQALDQGAGPKPTTVTLNPDGTRTLTWNVGALPAASGPKSIVFTARPTLLALGGTSYTNNVSLSFENVNGCKGPTLNAAASTSITVVPPTRDPQNLAFWTTRPDLWSAETLARIQATDQRYDGRDGSAPNGALSSAEVSAMFQLRPGEGIKRSVEQQLLTTYFNLATRRINAGTTIQSVTASRHGLSNVSEAALFATQTLTLPPTGANQSQYNDANTVLAEINNNMSERY